MINVAKAGLLASAAVCLCITPLGAQNTGAAAPPSNSSDIGPGELSNFTLNGTVTRPATRPPAAQAAPSVARPDPVPASPSDVRRVSPADAGPPTATRPDPANSDLFRRPPSLPDASAANAVTAAPPIMDNGLPLAVPALSPGEFSLLPWIVALLAAAGAGVIFFGRKRRRQGYAAARGETTDIGRLEPVPAPAMPPGVARSPVPTSPGPSSTGVRRPLPTTLMPRQDAPRASEPGPLERPLPNPGIPGGIVSTGLRPWIDVELTPDRALLDEAGVAIAFEVTLFNSGNAAARDVTIEAPMFNAGAQQDVELSAFFTAPATAGDPIPQIAPYARVSLRSAVRLTHAEVREYEIEGRKLFVPMVAISIRYRWASGSGHSAAGFLVGQGGENQEKLAPLRVDRGQRSWKGLGARRYEKGLRS